VRVLQRFLSGLYLLNESRWRREQNPNALEDETEGDKAEENAKEERRRTETVKGGQPHKSQYR
jgi:hypothetical protein